MFAASCANDEIQPTAPVMPSEERPAADFVLSVNEIQDETRAVFGNGSNGYSWYFEQGDMIGTMLMDTWNGQGEAPSNFSIVDYAHTNYPVIRDENGQWNIPANINPLAGNYFFYFPYEPVNNARGHFGFSINPIQPQYNKEGKFDYWTAVEQNQRYIGYDFVPVVQYKNGVPTTQHVKVDFAPLFAVPAFEFTNKAGNLIVDKIVIRATQDLGVDMYDKEQNKLITTTMAFLPGSGGFDRVKGQWKNNDGDSENETNLLWNHAMKYTSGVGQSEIYSMPSDDALRNKKALSNFYPLNAGVGETYKQAPAYEYVADYSGVEGGYVVNQFGKIRALLVMPGGTYDVDGFEAMIHVRPVDSPNDRYVVRLPLDLEDNNDDLDEAAGHDYLAPGKTTKFYANFDANAMKSYDITKSQITSSEDLLWMVQEAEKHTGNYKLIVNTTGKRVIMTKEIEDILAAKPNIHLYINGKINIGAKYGDKEAASSDAINKLYFDDNQVTTDLTIANLQVAKKKVQNCGTIKVESTGELATGTNDIVAEKIDNDGKITTANLITDDDIDEDIEGGSIENAGTIDAKNITAYILNKKAGNITALETVTGNADNKGYLKAKNITGTDAITCNRNHCCNAEGTKTHNVTVFNEGKLIVTQTITGSACNWGDGEAVTVTGTLRNVGQMKINNVPSFSNKQSGTLTFLGGKAGSNGAANRGGVINVEGTTEFAQLFNDGAKLNINADVTFTGLVENGYGEHKLDVKNGIIATITIAKDKTVKVKSPAELRNSKNAVINVDGNLGDNIKNSGEVFVKGQGQLIANGIVSEYSEDVIEFNKEFTKGIIDVTAADGTENDAQKARDMVAGGSQETNEGADMSNAFRYTIKKSTNAGELAAALKSRISSSNFLDNEVIIEFDANSKINYYGEFVKTMIKISHVLVKSGTELTFTATGDTKKVNFPFLHNTQDPATCPAYNAFEVASGAKLMVADKVTVTLPEIDFWANGEVNANDHSALEGDVTIKGAGTFWNSTANCAWKLDTTGKWIGEDYGF